MTVEKFDFMGHEATVIRPDKPNGKWVWKTEFLYAFDDAEKALTELGYTRVNLSISNRYGSYSAVRVMHRFYLHIVERYSLDGRCVLFGFSRGGLYAFNFALFYPEAVSAIYLDAPVLDLRTWPPVNTKEYTDMLAEYGLCDETLKSFPGNPVENLDELTSLGIPLLLVAGGADEIVPFPENSGRLIEHCNAKNVPLTYYVKPDGKHHPHSLADVSPIIDFITKL